MEKTLFLTFLFIATLNFSQKKISKTFEINNSKEIHIYTAGLDNIILQNTISSFVEVLLEAESYDNQTIKIEETVSEASVKFHFEGAETREVIFRKYITKRLQRASAIVKIPRGKKVIIFGENIDIASENLKNELDIYMENGIVKLHEILAQTTLKLYSGNVYVTVNNANIDVKSNHGKIKVVDKTYLEKYEKKISTDHNLLTINSIRAHIFINSN